MRARSWLLALMLLTLAPCSARAEWSADLYAGAAFTKSARVDATDTTGGVDITVHDVFRDLELERSVIFGGRVARWFDSLRFLGVGLDASHFRPDVRRQTVTIATTNGLEEGQVAPIDIAITAIAFDVMLRWPLLADERFPSGRLQPYLLAGPALFIAHVKDTTNLDPPRQSSTALAPGLNAGAGLAWQFHKHLAVFGEYRFTHFGLEAKARSETLNVKGKLSTDIDTHHAVMGVSVRY